jgi:cullin-associated NEDD8-dissociated protein 1
LLLQGSKTASATLILGLLTLGEIGRVVYVSLSPHLPFSTNACYSDFGVHVKTFAKTIELFSASSEDVRRSAAFAAGNIAVGNPTAFLPQIIQLIQADDKKRYLALQATKEVSPGIHRRRVRSH